MKILHLVLGKADPERSNGLNRSVDGLIRAQHAAGAKVALWCLTPSPAAATPAREYELRLFRSSRQRAQLTPELRAALRALEPGTIVHFHGGYHPEFHAVARLLAQRELGWVVTPHGAFRTAVARSAWIQKRAELAHVETRLLEDARAVHVFSAREAEELRHFAPRARLVVLPNGIDPRALGPLALRAGARPPLVFGFLGRLDAHTKGLDLLLAGFAHYVALGGTGLLALAGAGPDRAALRAQAQELGLAARVRFPGELRGARQRAYLARLDIFVHPSRHEGMPLALLEAAGSGLPCVLSRATNLDEAFERHGAGLVLDSTGPADIAAALTRCDELARAGELQALGRAARAMVQSDFDLARIGARSLALLYGAESAAEAPAA